MKYLFCSVYCLIDRSPVNYFFDESKTYIGISLKLSTSLIASFAALDKMRLVHLATLVLAHFLSLPSIAAQQLGTKSRDATDHSPMVSGDPYKWDHACPQLGPLLPRENKYLSSVDEYLGTEEFFASSAMRLSGAVRINTTSNDGMQELPGDDPAWAHMFAFSGYLNDTFPLIHRSLRLERINTHGLVYTWHGKNESLKPILLLAHQDVVPVEPGAEDIWEHPPFKGDFDGTYV